MHCWVGTWYWLLVLLCVDEPWYLGRVACQCRVVCTYTVPAGNRAAGYQCHFHACYKVYAYAGTEGYGLQVICPAYYHSTADLNGCPRG
eukprot:132141-Rhodomonas_salina.1